MLAAGVTGSTVAVAAFAALGTLAATVAGWWLKRRSDQQDRHLDALDTASIHSGNVQTSDAAELWKAMENMLDRTTDRADSLERQVDALSIRVDALSDSNDGLRIQLEKAHQLVEVLREERVKLQIDLSRVELANTHLETLNADLHQQVAQLSDLLGRK
jgi:chromosome segregation ATPase